WLFELKYDGFRAVLYLDQGRAWLVSRNGITYGRRFAALCAELAADIRVRNAVFDGEIVCLDDAGRPQFDRLFYRRGTPVFVVFDLLWLNGREYRDAALLYRKAKLSTVVSHASKCMLRAQHVLQNGVALYREACARDLEGIVAKPAQSLYAPVGNSTPWL